MAAFMVAITIVLGIQMLVHFRKALKEAKKETK